MGPVRDGPALRWALGHGIKGAGIPWDQIMENEFEHPSDRGGHGGLLAEKFSKKYCSYPE